MILAWSAHCIRPFRFLQHILVWPCLTIPIIFFPKFSSRRSVKYVISNYANCWENWILYGERYLNFFGSLNSIILKFSRGTLNLIFILVSHWHSIIVISRKWFQSTKRWVKTWSDIEHPTWGKPIIFQRQPPPPSSITLCPLT